MYYSPSKNGFFDSDLTGPLPDDVVEISIEEHFRLLEGQSQGQIISAGADGKPVLRPRPKLTFEQLSTIERFWRDRRLSDTDGIVARHRDELEDNHKSSLSLDEYVQLQAYRRALRNWPETGEFPLSEHRPQAPEWLLQQAQ
ncbi:MULTISPECIES: phage tail assembly chaperone [Pseudomonas]|uniref:Phage tail assembly chaperone n=1 Tax=Pseudomonas aphyarum TaxID=2942629 RepID=A0ABT5PVU3_9PSED|nr:phage tail assembly chaperone [Pseudomonas aphyarum]MDD0967233.1 phage tail assembly chaperone [Pseudomonas aphyarum]MDD1128016.1 phage tail assembly chaperone [Pseudomonas aphyarum]